MDVPLALNHIEIRHGLIEHRYFTSFCYSQCGCELSAFILPNGYIADAANINSMDSCNITKS